MKLDKKTESEMNAEKCTTMRYDSVQVSGMCQGCEAYHAGNLIMKIISIDGIAVLLIGTEGPGDGAFHVLAHPSINQIPGSSLLNALPTTIQ
jgi:hypothetical protein